MARHTLQLFQDAVEEVVLDAERWKALSWAEMIGCLELVQHALMKRWAEPVEGDDE